MVDAVWLDDPSVGYHSSGVRTLALPTRTRGPRRSKRLLAFASDERLVEHIRRGNEAAFEVVFERYGKGLLSFCRHMLGSQEEAEDAVQLTFASAYDDLQRDHDRELRLKPWLYTIARNRCLSMLRARRDELHVEREPATAGLAEEVERRAELREVLQDIGKLPAEQRAAVLLAEAADLSHAEIADVLDCEVPQVKALVYRARSALIERRDARATPCEEIREQLAVLSGGSLRRSGIRHHLSSCSDCRAYREEIKRQRQLLAAALPVVPPAWLKANVLGTAGGGGAVGGLGGAAGGGSLAAAGGTAGAGAAAPIGSAVLAKAAVLTVLAAGGGVATEAALDHPDPTRGDTRPAPPPSHRDGAAPPNGAPPPSRSTAGTAERAGRHLGDGANEPSAQGKEHGKATRAHGDPATKGGRGPAEVPGSRGNGSEQRSPHADGVPEGRGPPTAPPTNTPVRRGPVREERERPADPTPPPTAHQQGKLLEVPSPDNLGKGVVPTD
jgi:RNA polymerase sigma factor (sigma-70 family)